MADLSIITHGRPLPKLLDNGQLRGAGEGSAGVIGADRDGDQTMPEAGWIMAAVASVKFEAPILGLRFRAPTMGMTHALYLHQQNSCHRSE